MQRTAAVMDGRLLPFRWNREFLEPVQAGLEWHLCSRGAVSSASVRRRAGFPLNNRATEENPLNDADRFTLAASQISGKRLTYAGLTGKVGETEVFERTLEGAPATRETGLDVRFASRSASSLALISV